MSDYPMIDGTVPNDSGIVLRDAPSFYDIQRLQAIIGTYP
jgi:hypothetical protein